MRGAPAEEELVVVDEDFGRTINWYGFFARSKCFFIGGRRRETTQSWCRWAFICKGFFFGQISDFNFSNKQLALLDQNNLTS
jgi:hypothetical protein